ncbi:MAG: hypothetical protein DWQ46_13650 [Planctomycetota bacterium]|nr:MAG: hypothetical protein DWQ46_13650 [Planctomycetota bacterium]
MGRAADPKLPALWRDRVNRQRGSGLSIVDYCRREGFSTTNFHAWKRRLNLSRPAMREKQGNTSHRRSGEPSRRRGGFVRVPVAFDSAIEVRFADGTVVNVPGEHLAETLKTLKTWQPEGGADD